MDEQFKRLGFLAMMNPNAANKPPPAFIRRTVDPNFALEESRTFNLRMTESAELDKPIMKKKKRRGKATLLDDFEAPKKFVSNLDPVPEVKQEVKPVPAKPKEPEKPVEEKKEPVPVAAPAPVATPAPEPAPEPKAAPLPPQPVAAPAAAPKKKGFLDDSDDEDDDDDFFAKKKPESASKPAPTPAPAPAAASKKLAFLDSDEEDDDDDDSFD